MDDKVSFGATVESIGNGNYHFPVLKVGEEGRGRRVRGIPVRLKKEQYEKWLNGEKVEIFHAFVGKLSKGANMLIECDDNNEKECIVVMKNGIGYRGGNEFTGKIVEEWCEFETDWGEKHAVMFGFPLKKKYSYEEAKVISDIFTIKGYFLI